MAKTRSKSQGLLYASYKASNRQAVNRKRKLLKLQKQQPNNEQITAALANIRYRRHTPNTPHWSHTAKHYAQMFKQFKKQTNVVMPKISEKTMFSIKARAHTQGEPTWNSI